MTVFLSFKYLPQCNLCIVFHRSGASGEVTEGLQSKSNARVAQQLQQEQFIK